MQPLFVINSQSSEIIYNGAVKDWPLMQFTGLQDMSGADIYEGDIVKSFSNINKISDPHLSDREPEFKNTAVKFKGGAFILYCNEYDFLGVLGYNSSTKSETLEVIGDIYENSDLLEAQK
jgi:uncharacterized phage protein (TIGR01671 family)